MKINFQERRTPSLQIQLTDNSYIRADDITNRIEFSEKSRDSVPLTEGTDLNVEVSENWLTLSCVDGNALIYSRIFPQGEVRSVEMGPATH